MAEWIGAMESLVTPAFWHGRKVFVTGHTGFKGSWLCLWLHHMGAKVIGYALPPVTDPSLFELAGISRFTTSIMGDVRDRAQLQEAVQKAEPEIVIHMAAQALVRAPYADPVSTYETNVMGVVNLLEAVRASQSVRAVINVTSDKCYENREWIWGYREDEAMGGFDPYSSSKGCAELVTAAYRRSFFTTGPAIASARAGNVIGGGDWSADRVVPDIMRSIVAGRPALIRNPGAIRPWQHVLEPLGGYLTLAENLVDKGSDYAEAWNFGPGATDAVPVSVLADRLVALWGSNASWKPDPEAAHQPHEAHYLKLDSSKATARLQWQPRWTLDETLHSIITFHQAWLGKQDMTQEAIRQIETYMT